MDLFISRIDLFISRSIQEIKINEMIFHKSKSKFIISRKES